MTLAALGGFLRRGAQADTILDFNAGTDSWYWGVDDVGIYSLRTLRIASIVHSGANVIISWPGAADTRLQKSSSLTTRNWQDAVGSLGGSSATEPITGTPAFYRLVRPSKSAGARQVP